MPTYTADEERKTCQLAPRGRRRTCAARPDSYRVVRIWANGEPDDAFATSDADFAPETPPRLDVSASDPLLEPSLASLALTPVPERLNREPFQVVSATTGCGWLSWGLNGYTLRVAGFTLTAE